VGILSRLFGSKTSFIDRVWTTAERKLDDVVDRVGRDIAAGTPSILVYHFEATGEALEERLRGANVLFENIRTPSTQVLHALDTAAGPSTVPLVSSTEIPASLPPQNRPGAPVSVHLAEHFPTPSRDDHVVGLAAILPPKSTFTAYVALDEGWVRDVIGSSVTDIMKQLGMDEDECVTHASIASALRRAQEKLAARVRSPEQPARSSDEWMTFNLKPS